MPFDNSYLKFKNMSVTVSYENTTKPLSSYLTEEEFNSMSHDQIKDKILKQSVKPVRTRVTVFKTK